QMALEKMFEKRSDSKLLGILSPMGHQPPSLAQLFAPGPFPMDIGPLQHDEIDIGDPDPVRCLRNGLWLSRDHSLSFALLLGPSMMGGVLGKRVSARFSVPCRIDATLLSQLKSGLTDKQGTSCRLEPRRHEPAIQAAIRS